MTEFPAKAGTGKRAREPAYVTMAPGVATAVTPEIPGGRTADPESNPLTLRIPPA
jgi:hypothetical protein